MGKVSRWLWLGLLLNISIVVWRFWWVTKHLIALLPYRTVTDWAREPDLWMWALFYGAGFVGIVMAVAGNRRPLLFWNACYVLLLVPFGGPFPMNIQLLLRYPSNLQSPILIAGATMASIVTYIGHRRELRTGEATLSN